MYNNVKITQYRSLPSMSLRRITKTLLINAKVWTRSYFLSTLCMYSSMSCSSLQVRSTTIQLIWRYSISLNNQIVSHICNLIYYLSAGEFFSLCLNMPLIGYHIHRYMKRPVMSGPGLYDPTSIMNADVLNKCQREGWIKLAFYLLSFFYYLYGYENFILIDKLLE